MRTSRNTPEKNSNVASWTVSMRTSSQSSTTTNWPGAAHGESMYRSRFALRMLLAPRASLCCVCTRAEQSVDAKLKRSVSGTRKCGLRCASSAGAKETSSDGAGEMGSAEGGGSSASVMELRGGIDDGEGDEAARCFHSSKESRSSSPSSVGPRGGRGRRQHTGSSGSFGTVSAMDRKRSFGD
jgi:hypothetical protein